MPSNLFFLLAENKRCEMLETACKIFSQNTFDKVNIRQLSDAFGMSVGGFYRYFASKDDLYLYLIDWKLNDYYSQIVLKTDKDCDKNEDKQFWELFHHASADIRKKYYFRIKNNLLYSIQEAQVSHIPNIDQRKKTAAAFLMTVLPFVMRELSDLTGDSAYDGDYWEEIKKLVMSGLYNLSSESENEAES